MGKTRFSKATTHYKQQRKWHNMPLPKKPGKPPFKTSKFGFLKTLKRNKRGPFDSIEANSRKPYGVTPSLPKLKLPPSYED